MWKCNRIQRQQPILKKDGKPWSTILYQKEQNNN
jgi:hypothetical protein